MTRNQIEFLKLQEQIRNNSRVAGETERSNRERERQGVISLDEAARHNQSVEAIQRATLEETSRHNLAYEQETHRSNLVRESQNLMSINETRRANLEREKQNLIQLNEVKRSNLARESIQGEQLRLGRDQLNETIRMNQITSGLRNRELDEQIRSHTAQESISQQMLQHNINVLDEQTRHNKVSEATQAAAQITNAGYLAERVRADLADEAERARHNVAMELKDYSTKVYNTSTPVTDVLALPTNSSASIPVLMREDIIGSTTDNKSRTRTQYGYEIYSDGSRKYFKEVVGFGGKKERSYPEEGK